MNATLIKKILLVWDFTPCNIYRWRFTNDYVSDRTGFRIPSKNWLEGTEDLQLHIHQIQHCAFQKLALTMSFIDVRVRCPASCLQNFLQVLLNLLLRESWLSKQSMQQKSNKMNLEQIKEYTKLQNKCEVCFTAIHDHSKGGLVRIFVLSRKYAITFTSG